MGGWKGADVGIARRIRWKREGVVPHERNRGMIGEALNSVGSHVRAEDCGLSAC